MPCAHTLLTEKTRVGLFPLPVLSERTPDHVVLRDAAGLLVRGGHSPRVLLERGDTGK